MKNVKEYIDKVINVNFTKHGSFKVMNESKEEYDSMFGFDVDSDDIVIGYDYCDDEMNRKKEEDVKFIDWFDDVVFLELRTFLSSYKQVDDMDGSGNGLYYGVLHFKKK